MIKKASASFVIVLMLGCVAALGDGKQEPTTRLSFEQRQGESLKTALYGVGFGKPVTNFKLLVDENVRAVEQATPESLKTPRTIASLYYPRPAPHKTMGIFVFWLEDRLAVRKLVVRNPETRREITYTIPEDRLREELGDEDERVFIHSWVFFIPADFVNNSSQALEVRIPGQGRPSICYPAVHVDPKDQAALDATADAPLANLSDPTTQP